MLIDDESRPAIDILRELVPEYFTVLDDLIRQCESESLQAEIDAAMVEASLLASRGEEDAARALYVANLTRKRRIDVLTRRPPKR